MTTNNRDKIIAAAKVAGCHPAYLGSFYSSTEALERLYAIAFEDGRKDEREECAKICEKNLRFWDGTSDRNDDYRSAHNKDMMEIRARGDTK